MRLAPRHVALAAAAVMLSGCTAASVADPPPARRSPAVVPAAPSSAEVEAEPSPVAELIDPETSEQLSMRASATMTVAAGETTTTHPLVQSQLADTVIELNEAELRVLRLSVADAKRPDDVQLSVDGVATPGTFKTSPGKLVVVFYNAPLGVDLLSDAGECTVVFSTVTTAGASGQVTCADVDTPTGLAQLTATFTAAATDG